MGPLPVCPQSGWPYELQWEVCDFMRMIEAERKQCLEDAQLEDGIEGEAPWWEDGRCRPPRSPTAHVVSPHPHPIQSTLLERGSTKLLLGGEERMLGEVGEPDGRRKALTHLHVPIVHPRSGELPAVS